MELDDLKFEIQEEATLGTRIKVVGVGGGGCNAVSRMMVRGLPGVTFYALNTDAQALKVCPVPNKLALGARVTQGLGAGTDPEIGRQAALEDTDRIIEMLEGADMIFVAAGLGGGTGTGAAPVVCSLAKELNALTVAVVTRPFRFEGPRRKSIAENGLGQLAAAVDCVISIPNDRLVDLLPRGTSFHDAFVMADDVLRQGVQGISDIITTPGLINRDFADVRAIMTGMGFAMMGTASATGPNAAVEAAKKAMECPLLEDGGLQGAKAILLNVTASSKLTIHELAEACETIRTATENAAVQMNMGLVPNEDMDEEVRITVIATGFEREGIPQVRPSERAIISTPRTQSAAAGARESMVAPVTAATPAPIILNEPEAEAEPEPEPVSVRVAVAPQFEEEGFEFEDVETPAYLRNRRG